LWWEEGREGKEGGGGYTIFYFLGEKGVLWVDIRRVLIALVDLVALGS